MQPRSTETPAGKTLFAVYIHGYDLPIRDIDGTIVVGGLYTWRVVQASTRAEAVDAAIQAVCTSESYLDEVVSYHGVTPKFEADEIRILRADDPRSGTGLMFYIDTEEPS